MDAQEEAAIRGLVARLPKEPEPGSWAWWRDQEIDAWCVLGDEASTPEEKRRASARLDEVRAGKAGAAGRLRPLPGLPL